MQIVQKFLRAVSRTRGGVRRRPDAQRVAKAISGPGIDTRYWASAGTVGVLNPSTGEFVTRGELARQSRSVDENGMIMDVRLEPSGAIVTARYHGFACGRAGACKFPLFPGDEVLVVITDGDLNSAAITAFPCGANATAQIPTDWNNDRVLFDLAVPFQVRAPAIDLTSANLKVNGRRVNPSEEPI